MELDETTFRTPGYTIVDTVYQRDFAARKPRRPGKQPDLSASEVLTLRAPLFPAPAQPKPVQSARPSMGRAEWTMPH